MAPLLPLLTAGHCPTMEPWPWLGFKLASCQGGGPAQRTEDTVVAEVGIEKKGHTQ